MKVVEIIADLHSRGGAEVFFSSLCKKLSENRQIELTIISLWSDTDSSFNFLRNLNNVKFYELSKKKGVDFKASKKLRKILKQIQPDIINTHRSVLITYFFAFGFRRQKWHIVHTIHNTPSKEADRFTWFLRKKYEKKKIINYIGISDIITRDFLNIRNRASIRTVFNGIDLKECKIESNKKYDLINIARFSYQKNHKMLFDVFETIHNKNALKLICVGDGELLSEYKNYVSCLKCKEDVLFYGKTNEVYPLLAQSKIFVLSSFYEGNPISILEAMNCGLPIIAPCVGGIPDIVKEGINGFLFTAGSNEEMENKLSILLSNKKIYDKISIRNQLDAKKYSIENCSSEYINYFVDLLRNN